MDEWHQGQGDPKETCLLNGERDAAKGQATTKRGRADGEYKRKEKHGGPRGGGDEAPMQQGAGVKKADFRTVVAAKTVEQKKQPKQENRGLENVVRQKSRNGITARNGEHKQQCFVVLGSGGMSALGESKRHQAVHMIATDFVCTHLSLPFTVSLSRSLPFPSLFSILLNIKRTFYSPLLGLR